MAGQRDLTVGLARRALHVSASWTRSWLKLSVSLRLARSVLRLAGWVWYVDVGPVRPPPRASLGGRDPMPFASVAELPDVVRRELRGRQLEVFRAAWNAAYARHRDEGKAYAVAWAAAQQVDPRGPTDGDDDGDEPHATSQAPNAKHKKG